MRKIGPWTKFADVQDQLCHGDGAFLVSVDAAGRPNAMTIGWGLVGTVWGKPMFLALVRPSRYTHGLIERSGEFTVCVPLGRMKEELAFCGSRSGREVDKFKELGLEALPATQVAVPIVGGCDVAYECKVLVRTPLVPSGLLDAGVRSKYYSGGNLHTLFFGEIVAAWRL